MGTRTTGGARLRRQDIVAAVARLIAEKGLAALTMRDIAGQLRCSVGTLPHYFKGKDEMVAAALKWSNDRVMARIEEMAQRGIALENMVPIIISVLPLDEQSDLEWRVRMCLWDSATTNPQLLTAVEEVRDGAMEMLQRLIGHLQRQGEIEPGVPAEAICQTLYHLAVGMGFNLLLLPLAERSAQVLPLVSYIEFLRPRAQA